MSSLTAVIPLRAGDDLRLKGWSFSNSIGAYIGTDASSYLTIVRLS